MTSLATIADLRLSVQQFLQPKTGHEVSECEDAIGINHSAYRFAVADGATEAFDAGNWARRLAHNWVAIDNCLSVDEFSAWLRAEGEKLHESWTGLNLPWYSEEKARSGSFAAFAGLCLALRDGPHWQVISLGDSCFVQRRNEQTIRLMPVSSSADFSSTPFLAASNDQAQTFTLDKIVTDSGDIQRNDEFLLLTDAVAAWYEKLLETNNTDKLERFTRLLANDEKNGVATFLNEEVKVGRLKDDDIAVVRILVY